MTYSQRSIHAARIIGGALIVLGFAGLIFPGVPYQSTENVAEIGTFKMKVTEQKHFQIPPLLSGCLIFAGAALMFAPWNRPRE